MIKMRERESNNVHCVHVYHLPLSRLKKGGKLWHSRERPGILRVLNITLVAMFVSHNNIANSLI